MRLIVAPMQEEHDLLLQTWERLGYPAERIQLGRLPAARVPLLNLAAARGGTGKAQFAAQTQHLIDSGGPWSLAVCAGAAGALADDLAIGDVVAATETIEHDFRNRFNHSPLPRFPAAPEALGALRDVNLPAGEGRLHFGPVACGDEDIVDDERRAELREATGALAVAWEGAGGARAALFSGVPFVEIRGITDAADAHAPDSFHRNLELAMTNVATVLARWMQNG